MITIDIDFYIGRSKLLGRSRKKVPRETWVRRNRQHRTYASESDCKRVPQARIASSHFNPLSITPSMHQGGDRKRKATYRWKIIKRPFMRVLVFDKNTIFGTQSSQISYWRLFLLHTFKLPVVTLACYSENESDTYIHTITFRFVLTCILLEYKFDESLLAEQ